MHNLFLFISLNFSYFFSHSSFNLLWICPIILFLFDYIFLNHSYFILPSLTVSIIFYLLFLRYFPPLYSQFSFSLLFHVLTLLFTLLVSYHLSSHSFLIFLSSLCFFSLPLLPLPSLLPPHHFLHSFPLHPSLLFFLSSIHFLYSSIFHSFPSSIPLSFFLPPLQRSPHTTRCPRQLRQVHTANGQSATPRVPRGHQPQCDHAHYAQQQQRAVSGAGNTLHGRTRQGDSSEASADLDPRTARVLQWAQPQAAGPEERQAVDQQLDTAWLLRQSRDQRRLRHSQHGCSRGLCWKQLKWRWRQLQVTQSQQAAESADGDEWQTHVRGARHG